MAQADKDRDRPAADEAADAEDRSRANLVALVFIVALFAGAFWLFKSLQSHREIENCVASGRRDCIPLTSTDRGSP